MNAYHVRLAGRDDLPRLAPLFDAYRQFYEQAPDLETARRFLEERMAENQSVILVAERVDKLLGGFCQIYPSYCSILAAPIYLLSDLFVVPETRQTGVGRLLLEAAEAQAKKHKIPRLDLTTAGTNLKAQALYQSLGWTRDEVYFAYSKTL